MIIKPAPGHTPGHQVLFLKLPKTGPVLVAGDLYHYNEERNTDHVPIVRVQQGTVARQPRQRSRHSSRQSGAQLWIEHDYAANAKLKKVPAYYE